MKATPIPQTSRDAVRKRDHDRCARCKVPCPSPRGEWHHRRSKSVRDRLTHSPANGLLLCFTCHRWVHAHPIAATVCGWIVSRHHDPRVEPVVHSIFGRVFLTEAGSTSSVLMK